MVQLQTLIVDNGAYSMKIGTTNDEEPRIIPNAIFKAKHERKRVYIGDELADCTDRSSLFYVLPFEKGYLVNWDVEQKIWEKAFAKCTPDETRLVLTDPNYCIPAIQDQSPEVIFEQIGFHSLYNSSAAGLIGLESYNTERKRCVLVVDCGFSSSLIVPMLDGSIIQAAVIRIDVGGKALTNQLKDWISYRDLVVMEETYVMNECKEDSCFVSADFAADMKTASQRDAEKNTIRRQYVLPDFVHNQRGYLREPTTEKDELQALNMNYERFALPEALFRPSDIGVDQMGVTEAVMEAVGRCPLNLQPALLANIVLVGGSTKFPGFKERFLSEVSASACSEFDVKLLPVDDPERHAWRCGKKLATDPAFLKKFITRAEWMERGDSLIREKFYKFV